MGSRIRDRSSFKKLFITYFKAEIPKRNSNNTQNDNETDIEPIITYSFPPHSDPQVMSTALQFIPMQQDDQFGYNPSPLVELYTFVLTSSDSQWTFGYSRHCGSTTTVIISFLPWQEVYYRALNYIAELNNDKDIACFLERFQLTPIPDPGTCLYVQSIAGKAFIVAVPGDYGLPSIPENRYVSEYYNALSIESMIQLFTSTLSERRIVITSKKLSRLTSMCLALNLFLYPMTWQHIFIPLLPSTLIDYLSAPMPFIIGCPKSLYDTLDVNLIGSVVHVDGDCDTVVNPYEDSLPQDVISLMRKNLKGERVLGDGLARAHLRAMAMMIGHYSDCFVDGKFSEPLFVQYSHPTHRNFIATKLVKLQIFQQFVEEKEKVFNAGICISDEFEFEAMAWRSHSRAGSNFRRQINEQNVALKKAGKAVISNIKTQSGHLIDTVKANSTLKSAVHKVQKTTSSVKQKTSTSYSGFKSKFQVESSRDSPKGRLSLNSGSSNNLPPPHILNSSSSATELPSLPPDEESHPRLSRSEENLIDLESPVETTSTNLQESVFDDLVSDEQLIEAYGLNSYFEKPQPGWVSFD